MSDPIPILLLGKHPALQAAVSDIVQPEYVVVQQGSSVEDALKYLPNLLSGEGGSKIGLAIMGGGYSPADFERVLQEVPGARDIPWLRPDMPKPKPGAGPPQTPPAEVIAGRVKKCLAEHYEEVQSGKGAGQVWLF